MTVLLADGLPVDLLVRVIPATITAHLSTAVLESAAYGDLGTVYLLHFDRPYRHARHYTGWTRDLDHRLAEHATGRGARLMSVITDAGIGWQLARTWSAGRTFERRLKNRHGASRFCPICQQTQSRQHQQRHGGA